MQLDVRLLQFQRRRCENEPAIVESVAGRHGDIDIAVASVGSELFGRLESAILVHGQMPFQLLGVAQHFGWNNRRAAAHALQTQWRKIQLNYRSI